MCSIAGALDNNATNHMLQEATTLLTVPTAPYPARPHLHRLMQLSLTAAASAVQAVLLAALLAAPHVLANGATPPSSAMKMPRRMRAAQLVGVALPA
jgi:hypothetical protein